MNDKKVMLHVKAGPKYDSYVRLVGFERDGILYVKYFHQDNCYAVKKCKTSPNSNVSSKLGSFLSDAEQRDIYMDKSKTFWMTTDPRFSIVSDEEIRSKIRTIADLYFHSTDFVW